MHFTSRLNTLLVNMENNTNNLKNALKNDQKTVKDILTMDTGINRIRSLEEEVIRLQRIINEQNIHTAHNNDIATKDCIPKEDHSICQEQIEEYKNKYHQYKYITEEKIKNYLEEIVELKGSIRVICRIKPFTSSEEINITRHTIEIPNRSVINQFNKVLLPDASQEEVFTEVEDLIHAVTKGYRVSILAYGTTGSGKTYTMEGKDSSLNIPNETNDIPSAKGIVQRSLNLLEQELKTMSDNGWHSKVQVSIVEIYNDKILNKYPTEWIECTIDQIETMHQQASKERRTAATECNKRSSRSHLLLRLSLVLERTNITQTETNSNTQQTLVQGMLSIADLAGSERITRSNAQDTTLKESTEINKSLSSLADVVHAIQTNTQHTPYRNSKLTWLLKDSLGTGAKTAFIINLDPGQPLEENMSTLRFASRLQECKLGQSTIQRTTRVTKGKE
ncbi:kinesin family member C1 [Nematocida sp. AWRm80]|nr:kinesin family member C1 [Nematocida sp. AWRm80]